MSQYDNLDKQDNQKIIDTDKELAEISTTINKSYSESSKSSDHKSNDNGIYLIECPACHKSISNHAYNCPHCGHPMKPQKTAYAPSSPQPMVQQKSGIGFWGIVFAVIVALLILSIG